MGIQEQLFSLPVLLTAAHLRQHYLLYKVMEILHILIEASNVHHVRILSLSDGKAMPPVL